MSIAEAKRAPLSKPAKAVKTKPGLKAYRLKTDLPTFALTKGATVYLHPDKKASFGVAVSVLPYPDEACFPCWLSDLEEVTP